ncbi:DNA repair protein RadC [Wolbachia endosymbiont of Listronotus oregonensis]|uniref:JAB domain-containing protein n=1 Tax=Wolbachia endosymbiont of Listronotus oregonensis TaxID=2969106 RepID=UPI002815BE63|nr:DNA repair protein RadC [Wolbachia endosymbiont of Listronotus oregonensis]WMT84708.1 DNA repair protein RadC [Wolbachia endosymbiont of Listronotus oregonensis]
MNNKNKDENEFIEEIKRVKQSGGEALLDHEIVVMLLSSVHDKAQAQAIAGKLMDTCKGIGGILGREMYELKLIDGVTDSAVAAIECVKQAPKRALREDLKKGPVMDNYAKLVEYIRVNIGLSAKEAAMIIYLDKQYHLIEDEVHMGTIDEVYIYEREVIKKALTIEAKSIILSHNHPEGRLKPSDEDEAVTKDLAKACQTIGIRLLDHIIITSVGYFSFKEQGLL